MTVITQQVWNYPDQTQYPRLSQVWFHGEAGN